MDIQLNNEDINEIRSILGRLSNTLDQFVFRQDVATDISDKFYADNILNVLKEENDLVTNSRKLKQLFLTAGDQRSESTDSSVHDKQLFDDEVVETTERNHCIETLRCLDEEPEKNKTEKMTRQDRYEHNRTVNITRNYTENSLNLAEVKSTFNQENQAELRESQESKEDEDILDLMASELDYYYHNSPSVTADVISDADDNVTMNTSLIEEKEKCEQDDNFISQCNINNINNPNLNIQKTKHDYFERHCFSYLKTKTCGNPKCIFIHEFPTTELMLKMLENLYPDKLFDLVNITSLRKKYGDCFAKTFSRRPYTKQLLTIMTEFLQRWPDDNITNRIVDITLNYFNKNDVNLKLYRDLMLRVISPERQVYMVLIERVLKRNIKNKKAFESFTRVCLLLTDFIIIYCGEVKISITETFIRKFCNEQYNQSLAIALVNMMRCTSTKIFENSAIHRLEEVLKRDTFVYKEYLQLKEVRKKNDGVKNKVIVSRVQNKDSKDTSTASNELQDSNGTNQPVDTPEHGVSASTSSKSETLIDSTRSNDPTGGARVEERNIDYVCRYPRQIPRNYQHLARPRNNSRDMKPCIYYITERCTQQNCKYAHILPDLNNIKVLIEQLEDQKLSVLINHQGTVKRFGKCLAQTLYERGSTKQLIMLAVECFKLSDVIPDSKTEVLNITLHHINRPEVNVRMCEQLLSYKVQKKSVQFLLLEHLLCETSADLTKALIVLIDSMCESNETFNYCLAECVLGKLCSSYSDNLARAFIKVVRLTTPKIFKHPKIPCFEGLLTDKDLSEEYNALKRNQSDNAEVPNQRANESASTSRNIAPPKSRRTSNPDETLARSRSPSRSKPAATIRGRRHTIHPETTQTTPSDEELHGQPKKSRIRKETLPRIRCSPRLRSAAAIRGRRHSMHPLVAQTPRDLEPHDQAKKSRKKIHPCSWAPLVDTSNINSVRNHHINGQDESL